MSTFTKTKKPARRASVKKSAYRMIRKADGLVVTHGPVRVTSEEIRALAADIP